MGDTDAARAECYAAWTEVAHAIATQRSGGGGGGHAVAAAAQTAFISALNEILLVGAVVTHLLRGEQDELGLPVALLLAAAVVAAGRLSAWPLP